MPVTKGVMGFVDFGSAWGLGSGQIRVTSAGLKAAQDISAMETIDSQYDFTAYRLGPVRVEGDVAFPVPATSGMMENIIRKAGERHNSTGATNGQLVNKGDVTVFYDTVIGYKYEDCKINTMSINIASENAVEATWALIGTKRTTGTRPVLQRTSPERVLTWNDVSVSSGELNALPGSSAASLNAEQVTTFSFELNNNLTAFFGLNGKIFVAPDNIVAGKREITGSIEAAWNGSGLENYAYALNAGIESASFGGVNRCSSNDKLFATFNKCTGGESGDASGSSSTEFNVRFNGVVFNMEDISVTNDFFKGTQTWRAYGEKFGNRYSAISISNGNGAYTHL